MRTLLVALCLLVPAGAFAQSSPEDRQVQKLNEVERGVFLGVEAGGLFLFSPKANANSGFSPGRTFSVTLGADIGRWVSAGLLVMGTQTDTPSGFASDNAARGDFSSLLLGATARIHFYGVEDANSVQRLFLHARLGGGYALMAPKDFYKDGDIVILAGVGLEYFTHLRHFSLGLTVDFLYGIQHMGPGLTLVPHLRYTF